MPQQLGTIVAGVASVLLATLYCKFKHGIGDDHTNKLTVTPLTPTALKMRDTVDKSKIERAPENTATQSSTRSTNTGTTISEMDTLHLQEVVAKPVTLADLAKHVDGGDLYKTVRAVASEFYQLKQGGALIVICECNKHRTDRSATFSIAGSLMRILKRSPLKLIFAEGKVNPRCATLPIANVGDGSFMKILKRSPVKCIFADGTVNPIFRTVLEAYAKVPHEGPNADKWTRPLLEVVARALGTSWDTDADVRALLGAPADGALVVLSLRGTVVAASAMISIIASMRLTKPNGKGTGTKHTAALSAVEWCRLKSMQGAAVVRSDNGDVTVVCVSEGKTSAFQLTG